jgi:hypothetical protein
MAGYCTTTRKEGNGEMTWGPAGDVARGTLFSVFFQIQVILSASCGGGPITGLIGDQFEDNFEDRKRKKKK